jgi:hypothetical protein
MISYFIIIIILKIYLSKSWYPSFISFLFNVTF